MKRFISLFIACALFVLLFPAGALAVPPEFSGGINNEYEYSEYVFLSGEPVKFVGSLKTTESESKGKKTVTYRFSLESEDEDLEGKLSRQVTYVTTYTSRDDKGQTIAQTSVTRMRESITIGEDSYELADFQFSKSDVIDNRPVSNFYCGNIVGRKYYTINDSEGKVIVDLSGGDVGYENFWGSTDTQIINHVIKVERQIEGEDASWQGTVKIQVSDSTTKTLKYSSNAANYSSFPGGHARITEREMVSRYDYVLPRMNDGFPHETRRRSGTKELSASMVPKIEMLVVPKFRDIGGHWAEDDINKLYSLDVFDDDSGFFSPDTAMTRIEFTKAVMNACNIRPTVETKKVSSGRNRQQETSPFKDIEVTDSNYPYIKDALAKGIIFGVTRDLFKPEESLTRVEAIVILIRALGFENRAPAPGFSTSFNDDALIPEWAKDSVYVAREIGLVAGDPDNKINPGKVLTRAEASSLLVKFLEFLEKDLQKDYRENIILYN